MVPKEQASAMARHAKTDVPVDPRPLLADQDSSKQYTRSDSRITLSKETKDRIHLAIRGEKPDSSIMALDDFEKRKPDMRGQKRLLLLGYLLVGTLVGLS